MSFRGGSFVKCLHGRCVIGMVSSSLFSAFPVIPGVYPDLHPGSVSSPRRVDRSAGETLVAEKQRESPDELSFAHSRYIYPRQILLCAVVVLTFASSLERCVRVLVGGQS